MNCESATAMSELYLYKFIPWGEEDSFETITDSKESALEDWASALGLWCSESECYATWDLPEHRCVRVRVEEV